MWVSSPERTVCEINPDAENLLELKAQECLWRPCFEVVAALDSSGRPFCRKDCPIRKNLRAGLGLEVHHLQMSRRQSGLLPFHLLPIAVKGPKGPEPWLVHCVIEAGRCQRLYDYLARVANRPSVMQATLLPDTQRLTPRETEILELLVEDRDLLQIARDLHVSYHTIRNHIQHILPKLSAHSIHQAIATFLLQEGAPPE